MSNSCSNLIHITGPSGDRNDFVADIHDVGGWDHILDAHVHARDLLPDRARALGTRGLKEPAAATHNHDHTEIWFRTHWGPPLGWLELVIERWPELTFELLCGSLEGAFVGYTRAEYGAIVVRDFTNDMWARPFYERHGWREWWTPLCDASDLGYDLDAGPPLASEVLGAEGLFAASPRSFVDALVLTFPPARGLITGTAG